MLVLKLFIKPSDFYGMMTNGISEALGADEFDSALVVLKSRGGSG